MKLHLAELRRRGVFNTVIAYAVAAWVLIEVADVIAPAFLLPEWFVAALMTLLVLGAFPVILLSWRYDITWEGIKRDSTRVSPEVERSARRISAVLAVSLLGITAALWVNYFRLQSASEVENLLEAQQGAPEIGSDGQIQSVAVLPFDDYSPGGGKQVLADGIAEAILHALAQNRELVVTSRRSSFMFRDKEMTAAEIGRILKVQALLEGSIQIVEDQLRVTAQLIRTSDQAHIWSRVFEAPLVDLFKVNDEIALEVSNLILPDVDFEGELATWSHPPSVEAFRLLLEARDLARDPETNVHAIRLLQVILELWPDYADAWAWLGVAFQTRLDTLISGHSTPFSEMADISEQRTAALDTALKLDPGNHLALLSKGALSTLSGSSRGYHEALEKVFNSAPNDPAVLNWLGGLASFSLEFQWARDYLSRARAVDPGDYEALWSYLWSTCGDAPAIPDVEAQLRDYPASRIQALKVRELAEFCDHQLVDSAVTSIELARISDDPTMPLLALISLAAMGDAEALTLINAAHRLLPRDFNRPVDGLFTPEYFVDILPQRLDMYRRHTNSEFANRNSARMYMVAQVLAGEYEQAERSLDSLKRMVEHFYASEEAPPWTIDVFEIFAWKAWFLSRRGATDEAREIADVLAQQLARKGLERWANSRGRAREIPLMVLLLNGRQQQATDWLLDAERDQWLFFQPILTSPVYAEFREIPEVSAALERMMAWREGLLQDIRATAMPEAHDPSMLIEYMDALVKPSYLDLAQVALHFDDSPVAALQYYQNALSEQPGNLEIVKQFGDLALQFGLVDEAVQIAEYGVALYPEDSSAWYNLSLADACAGRRPEALEAIQQSVVLNPDAGYAERWLGMMLIENRKPEAALEVMQSIEEGHHRRMGLILAYSALGRRAESDTLLQEWLEQGEGFNPFHLAYTLAFCGEIDLAFEWLQNAATVRRQVSLAAVFPFLSRLHDDPRWLPFLESIGKGPEQLAPIELVLDLPQLEATGRQANFNGPTHR
jgi:TolB-like protein/tetratricopeptide (TPR) repeat protein